MRQTAGLVVTVRSSRMVEALREVERASVSEEQTNGREVTTATTTERREAATTEESAEKWQAADDVCDLNLVLVRCALD